MAEFPAWAVAVVIISLAFMGIFHRNIRGLIDRTKSVKLPGGFHAEGEASQQQLPAPRAAADALSTEQLGSPTKDALFEPFETEARRLIAASVPDPKFHFDWALRLFAGASVARDNEYCYRLIFGSQIKALKQAVQSGGVISDQKLKAIYDQTSFHFPEAYDKFEFHHWRAFFPAQKLGTIESDNSLKLAAKAYAFLSWLAISGATEEKIF